MCIRDRLSTDFKKVVDKTLTPIPWTTPNDYPKMDHATEVKWLRLGNWVNQVPFRVLILGKRKMWVWVAISSPPDFNQGTNSFLCLLLSLSRFLDRHFGFLWRFPLTTRSQTSVPRSPLPLPENIIPPRNGGGMIFFSNRQIFLITPHIHIFSQPPAPLLTRTLWFYHLLYNKFHR